MHRLAPLALGVALALGITATAAAATAPVPAAASTAIPPMPLKQALAQFAEREHLQFVYVSEVAAGVRTPGAAAGLSQRAALGALLRGTGLRYRFVDANTVVISRGPPQRPADPPPAPAAQPKPAPATLQSVIVTGTRAFGRTATESLSPIDVLTPQELASTGAPDLTTALRILLPSFNFPQPAFADLSGAVMPAQLRGLPPDDTLVLIDGKRQHATAIANMNNPASMGSGSSPVDLAAIPIGAVQRIEVLRDGAAAQYGSSAIAGVINIILKGGAGNHGAASVTRGVHDGGQGQTWKGDVDGGFALGNQGWVHLSASYLNQLPTNHAGPENIFPGDPSFGKVTFQIGLPREVQKQMALNAQYNLGANATLYAFDVFSKRNVVTTGLFRTLAQYRSSSPAAAEAYPEGFLPHENGTSLDNSTVLGVRGDVAGWHYDVSGSTGTNHFKLNLANTFNYSLAAASPLSFYDGTLVLRENALNADFSRDLDVGWASPLTVAWGLAYRRDKFAIKEGDPASYAGTGAQGFPGFQPGDAGSHARRSYAEYLDLEADLTSKLSGGVAARHENYSDFGSTTVWKVSGRYAFTPVVALRGTISTGFRAPSLQQEFYSSTNINIVSVNGESVPMSLRTFPVSDPAAIALGAQPLEPEQSHNYSLGLVFTPTVGPYVTLDAYEINIADHIAVSGNLTGTAVQQYLTSVGIPFVDGGRFFTNAASTHTVGADLVATWPVRLAHSSLKFTGGANYNKTSIRSIRANPPQLALHGLTLPILDRQAQGLLTVVSPHSKAFVGADWQFAADWTLHGQVTRYGGWTVLNNTPSFDDHFPSRTLADASVTYQYRRWAFVLGGNNVFNVYPAKSNSALNLRGIIPYPVSSPFGFSGAYWYATATCHW